MKQSRASQHLRYYKTIALQDGNKKKDESRISVEKKFQKLHEKKSITEQQLSRKRLLRFNLIVLLTFYVISNFAFLFSDFMWFLLFTMFVVFSFSCSDDVLTDENVQTLILVSFSQPKKNVSTAEGSKMKLNQKKFNL